MFRRTALSLITAAITTMLMIMCLGISAFALNETSSAVALPAEMTNPKCMYFNEQKNGIYFIKSDNKPYFYSIETGSLTAFPLEEVRYNEGYYFTDNRLYCLCGEYRLDSEDNVYREAFFVQVYDLDTGKKLLQFDTGKFLYGYSIGADGKGRIYVSGKSKDNNDYIGLYSPTGESLGFTETDPIYSFIRFNDTDGEFLVVSYYNWVYWGYDHAMNVVRCAKVTADNKIEYSPVIIDILCQQGWYERASQVSTDGDYLFADSTFNNLLRVYDLSTYKLGCEDADMLFSNTRVNKDADGNFDKNMAYGPRAIYWDKNDSFIAYSEESYLAEYDKSGNIKSRYKAQYTPYALFKYNGRIFAIEKNGDLLYYEYIDWKDITKVDLKAPSTTMTVGDIMQLTATTDGNLIQTITWTSSNPKILSVDDNGKVTAMAKGSATITATTASGIKKSVVINVTKESPIKTPDNYSVNMSEGEASDNVKDNNYSVWSSRVKSYLYEYQGKHYRVENIGEYATVEQLDLSAGGVVNSKKITHELPLFGGFYSGTKYNFLVYGAVNENESDDFEVIRIVKYDKNWKRTASVSVKGANTRVPFDAGSLRMDEHDGILYIHTCHKMYTSTDGYNHQANMTFKLDIDTMEITDQYYKVMNISQAGYVSHSFNQFVKTDGEFVYRVDHGDAGPRAISITKASHSDPITKVSYILPVRMTYTTGYNDTGVSVGGFELTDDNCIIAGNAVEVDKATNENPVDSSSNRNIFLSVTSKSFENTKFVWITSFDAESGVTVSTPQMVKFGYDNMLVIWEVYKSNSYLYTEAVTVNGRGELTSDIMHFDARLSDCAPVYCSDGYIRWYSTSDSTPCFYQLCAFDLPTRHMFGEWTVTKQPTCTDKGVKERLCLACGERETDEINATGHKFSTEWTVDTEPTCTEKGSKSHHCTVCDAKTDITAIDATGHTFDKWKTVKEPTCTEVGTKERICLVCSAKETDTIEATGHSFGDWRTVKEPTCTESGTKERICFACSAKETDTIKATGHKYSTEWTIDKAATCTEAGSKSHHCEKCDAKTDITEIPATGHRYVDSVVNPTYTERGYTLHECEVCGYSYKDNYTDKLILNKPSGFKVKFKTADTVTLTWSKNPEATGYIIEQYKGNKWVRIAKITSNATTTCKVTGLSPITRNAFRMRCYKNIPGSAVKSAYTGKLVAYTNPNNMKGFKASGKTNSTIKLCWTKNDTATGYILEQYKGNKWVRIAKLESNDITSYYLKDLNPSTRHAFRIQAYKEIGKGAVKSEYTAKLIVYTNPDNMTGFKAVSRTSSTITLSWDKNDSATGYILEKFTGGKWVRIAKLENNDITSYEVTGLLANTRCAFRIQAYKNIPNKGAVKSAYTSKLVVYTEA